MIFFVGYLVSRAKDQGLSYRQEQNLDFLLFPVAFLLSNGEDGKANIDDAQQILDTCFLLAGVKKLVTPERNYSDRPISKVRIG